MEPHLKNHQTDISFHPIVLLPDSEALNRTAQCLVTVEHECNHQVERQLERSRREDTVTECTHCAVGLVCTARRCAGVLICVTFKDFYLNTSGILKLSKLLSYTYA